MRNLFNGLNERSNLNTKDLLMKLFVYEISHIKNHEYDMSNIINDFKECQINKGNDKYDKIIHLPSEEFYEENKLMKYCFPNMKFREDYFCFFCEMVNLVLNR